MLNKIFITIILLCGIASSVEATNCIYRVSQFEVTFKCHSHNGIANYKFVFHKNTGYCDIITRNEDEITTLNLRSFYYDKIVKDEFGATLLDKRNYVKCEDYCRDEYLKLKKIAKVHTNNAYNEIAHDLKLTSR